MKQTKSRKAKSSKAKRSTNVKKNTQRKRAKWGIFLNSRFVKSPFKCDEGNYDESGEYYATMIFDNEMKAKVYYEGAVEARRLIFDWIFGGDLVKATQWLDKIHNDVTEEEWNSMCEGEILD